jgi:hypothetical protein
MRKIFQAPILYGELNVNLKVLVTIFMTLSVAISCSDVKFTNAPSADCAAADTCEVTPRGERLSKDWIVPNANKQVDILFVIDKAESETALVDLSLSLTMLGWTGELQSQRLIMRVLIHGEMH